MIYLNLSQNEINTLADDCFLNLTELKELFLNDNAELDSISDDCLKSLPKLERLELESWFRKFEFKPHRILSPSKQ